MVLTMAKNVPHAQLSFPWVYNDLIIQVNWTFR